MRLQMLDLWKIGLSLTSSYIQKKIPKTLMGSAKKGPSGNLTNSFKGLKITRQNQFSL